MKSTHIHIIYCEYRRYLTCRGYKVEFEAAKKKFVRTQGLRDHSLSCRYLLWLGLGREEEGGAGEWFQAIQGRRQVRPRSYMYVTPINCLRTCMIDWSSSPHEHCAAIYWHATTINNARSYYNDRRRRWRESDYGTISGTATTEGSISNKSERRVRKPTGCDTLKHTR